MKKPGHPFASLLRFVALLLLIGGPICSALTLTDQPQFSDLIEVVSKLLDSTIPYAAGLAGLAVLIELVDQIRWQGAKDNNQK